MSVSERLDYQYYYGTYAAAYAQLPRRETIKYFERQALEMHALGISIALDRLVTDALLIVSAKKLNERADHFLRYGAMRRLRMVQGSYRTLRSVIDTERTTPLSSEESDLVSRDLNALYINIIGVSDNYAWTLIHQFGSDETKALPPMAIGLVKPRFARDPKLPKAIEELGRFSGWNAEVRTRRNPAAHQMPLYVPPSAMTPSDVDRFYEIEARITEAINEKEYDRVNDLRESQRKIGVLTPVFLHDPTQTPMWLYPTLPEDLGNMIGIGRLVHSCLE